VVPGRNSQNVLCRCIKYRRETCYCQVACKAGGGRSFGSPRLDLSSDVHRKVGCRRDLEHYGGSNLGSSADGGQRRGPARLVSIDRAAFTGRSPGARFSRSVECGHARAARRRALHAAPVSIDRGIAAGRPARVKISRCIEIRPPRSGRRAGERRGQPGSERHDHRARPPPRPRGFGPRLGRVAAPNTWTRVLSSVTLPMR
jgi:hypothetical protein